MSDLYDGDFFLWAARQAELLRSRAAGEIANDAELDWLNLAEEIESVGASQRSEVRRRLELICHHLLKWQYQPEHQSRSWQGTIHVQRRDLLKLFEDSPSLRSFAADERVLRAAFRNGREDAERETGLLRLPDVCPWTFDQIIHRDFWPDDTDGDGIPGKV